jgi:transposase
VRHLLVDTLGLPLAAYVTPVDVQERTGARCLLAGLKPLVPRLKKIWADGPYGGEHFQSGVKARVAGSLRSSDATQTPRALKSDRKYG